MMGASYILSGTLTEEKGDFEHELLAGTETVGDTVDAGHIAIVLDDAIDVGETQQIETCIRRLMERFKELGYVAS
jgi:hypothetical protein